MATSAINLSGQGSNSMLLPGSALGFFEPVIGAVKQYLEAAKQAAGFAVAQHKLAANDLEKRLAIKQLGAVASLLNTLLDKVYCAENPYANLTEDKIDLAKKLNPLFERLTQSLIQVEENQPELIPFLQEVTPELEALYAWDDFFEVVANKDSALNPNDQEPLDEMPIEWTKWSRETPLKFT